MRERLSASCALYREVLAATQGALDRWRARGADAADGASAPSAAAPTPAAAG